MKFLKFKRQVVSRIKQLRENLKLTQQDLAQKVGISRQTIYYLERGTYNPSITLSLKIAEVFGKPTDEIFYLEPVIKSYVDNTSTGKIRKALNKLNMEFKELMRLTEMSDSELTNTYTEEKCRQVSKVLGTKFEDLFLIE
ncbi:MAG: helix-turn-helix domain-containing protein [Candidatus Lokiarchaeota archaeon]|nr:helix-turn-helix domain-containing protein [Candidatus Lokiarchaeota archaeon]